MPSSRTLWVLLLPLATSACFTWPDERTLLGVLAVEPQPFEVEIVKEGVSGEHCPRMFAVGDYGVATQRAIASAPPSTLLVNAKFWSYENLFSAICVKVTGDAAVLK